MDAAENLVAPALQAQVDDLQLSLVKQGKIGVGLAQDIAGIGVDSYASKPGKRGRQCVKNRDKPLRVQHQGVSVRKKDATRVGNPLLGQGDVFQHLLDRTDSERLVRVGAAERAAVVRTTVRDLQDVAVRLARRPDDHAVVSHGPIIREGTTTDNWPCPLAPVGAMRGQGKDSVRFLAANSPPPIVAAWFKEIRVHGARSFSRQTSRCAVVLPREFLSGWA